MPRMVMLFALLSLLLMQGVVRAGLYNPLEPPPSIDGSSLEFLDRLQEIRGYGPPDLLTVPEETKRRQEYLQRVAQLREKEKTTKLTAEELAGLGAYLVRLRRTQNGIPDYEEALKVLEAARRAHPREFAIVANLGTVYQLTGRLDAAESCLQESSSAAPPEWRRFERYHHLLVRLRLRESSSFGLLPLDELFRGPDGTPLRYVGASGSWQIGQLAASEQAKLPDGSLAEGMKVVRQLLVWLPEDGRLHWQFAELANAQGEIKAATNAMQVAVDLFRLSTPALKRRRVELQEAAAWREVLARLPKPTDQGHWVGRTIAAGIPPATPAAGIGMEPLALGMGMPRPPELILPDLNVPPRTLDDLIAGLGWKAWTGIGLGALLILSLLVLQLREYRRRRTRRAPSLSPRADAQ